MTLKVGRRGPGPIEARDLTNLVTELTGPGSQVDSFLVCINAQVMYYPSQVGTQRGADNTVEERRAWPAGEQQRFANLQKFFDAGLDPYAILIGESKRRGIEALISFRMNDAHGNDFLRTRFWREHPDLRLPGGALDFGAPTVRDYVIQLIEESIQRYDQADGIELDFQRFPRFFRVEGISAPERVVAMNHLVHRVRGILDREGRKRARRLVLAVRAPSGMGNFEPTPERALELGCDLPEWARRGWMDFLSVSEWLFTRETLGIQVWKQAIPNLPIYGAIQPETQASPIPDRCEFCLSESAFRARAWERWREGADGIYLFNFFTTREWPNPSEPPFEILSQIGSRKTLTELGRAPWETNRPVATVTRLLHDKHPVQGAAAMGSVIYVGPGLQRREWRALERVSDVADQQRARWSEDNGRTWSDWIPQQPSSMVEYAGTKVWEGGWADAYDPKSGKLVQLWLRQIELKSQFHCVTYSRYSTNSGRSWSTPQPLTYEPGPAFDPSQPAAPEFLRRNQGYPGNNLCLRRDGTLVIALAHANAPGDSRNDGRAWRLGSILFSGRWDPTLQDYLWAPGARTEVTPEVSARGLMEPEVAELRDGRLLVVWRGSNTGWDGSVAREPGRKWYAISTDGGQTLGPVKPWTYTDGASFYSASSIHRMLRHSQTGRLYWIGNISIEPPHGNHPRHPLVMGEVDEVTGLLKRETLTVLAERGPQHGREIQFSNFSLIENRETHVLELLLTTYGQELNPRNWATADCWKYIVQLRGESSK